MKKKSKSGTEMAIEVLNNMLEMTPAELYALMKKQEKEPEHWSTPILRKLGYFDRLAKNTKRKK